MVKQDNDSASMRRSDVRKLCSTITLATHGLYAAALLLYAQQRTQAVDTRSASRARRRCDCLRVHDLTHAAFIRARLRSARIRPDHAVEALGLRVVQVARQAERVAADVDVLLQHVGALLGIADDADAGAGPRLA